MTIDLHKILQAVSNNFQPFGWDTVLSSSLAVKKGLQGSEKQLTPRYDKQTKGNGGAEGARTPDLCVANAPLSQLSYSPTEDIGKSSEDSFY